VFFNYSKVSAVPLKTPALVPWGTAVPRLGTADLDRLFTSNFRRVEKVYNARNIFLIGIMHVSQNVSIRWEINFYDKNTC
jgi:hypothetical protein